MGEVPQVNVPKIGKVKKVYVWGAIGVVGAYVAWRWYSAGAAGSGETEDATADVGDGVATGGAGAAGGSGNVQYAGSTTDTDAIDTNAEWTQKAVELLSNAGYNATTVYAALGDYLSGAPLTATEQTIVRAALAAVGAPPVGGPYVIREQVGEVTLKAPTGVRVTAVTSTSASLSWTKVEGASWYRVYRDGVTQNVGGTDTTTITVGGLEPNKEYRFRVRADTTTGKSGPYSAKVTAKTKSQSLAKPATPTVSQITRTSAHLSTRPVSGARSYLWYINGVAHGHSDNPSYRVSGLRPNVTYSASVKADVPTQGPGPESGRKTFKTKK